MLVVLRPAFFCGENSFSCNVSGRVVFLLEVLQDPKAWLVIVPVRARLFVALSVCSVSLGFGIVMPVGADICIEDV